MDTANIPGSHLNPQQATLFSQSPGTRKRWIWSKRQDHIQLLASLVAREALENKPVIVWYDEESSAIELLQTFPLDKIEKAIYCPVNGRSNAPQHVIKPLSPAESIHHIEIYKLAEDLQRISRPWDALHEELWPGTNRYELIQKFAGLFNHNSVNPLFYRLSRPQFEISPAEYKRLRHKIEHYIKLSKLRQDGFEYLDLLDVSLLINHSLDFVKSDVMQYVALMAHQATELLKRSDWIMMRYFDYVKSYWIREINIYVNKIDRLLSHARELQLTYGEAFSFESSMSQLADRLKGQISRKAKMISQDRKAIKAQYLELLEEIEAGQPWVTIPSVHKDSPSLAEAIDYLRTLKANLTCSKDAIETHIRSQLKRLNSHNAPEQTGLQAEIREWEDDLLKWYSNINISGYFKKRFESQALSVHRSAEGLREVNTALSAIVERQHYLEDYFFWAGFQNQFPDQTRNIVQALHLVPVQDWLIYFDEWYITQLITGEALEVDWPEQIKSNLKEVTERIRHHAMAEYVNEVTHHRIHLSEEHAPALRKLTSRKSGIDLQDAEQFFADMSIDARGQWYPIQCLPLSMMPAREDEWPDATPFILLRAKDPSAGLHWQKVQEMPCDVFAWEPPFNQRYLNERLDMPAIDKDFNLQQNRNSSALKYLTLIARQFGPFLDQTCIYAAHRVNVISMLGPELDRLVLDQLPMPYKISERSLHPDENFLIETLLEPNKPFVLLVRDYFPAGAWPVNSLWHLQFQEDLDKVGIKVIHSWSKGWLMESEAEVRRVRDEILQFVGNSFTGMQVVSGEW